MTYTPPNYDQDFKGKVAIVTGAASGIGKSIAEGLAHHGASVCILDKNLSRGLSVEEEFREKSLGVRFYETDVSNVESVQRSVEYIVNEEGAPSILVNNAGIEYSNEGNLVTMPKNKMMEIINTNFLGYINMLREIIPHMEGNGGGRIINISSVQATQSCLPGTIYAPTKQGILGLTRIINLEYARKNIRANTISPGDIRTEGIGAAWIEENPNALDDSIRSIPLGRRGHPEEVANAALFLLSESSSYISGAELVVDGGMLNTLVGDMGLPETPVPNDPDN